MTKDFFPPGLAFIRALIALVLALICLITSGSLSRAQDEPTMSAQALVDAAVDQLQAADSVKLSIEQTARLIRWRCHLMASICCRRP